MLLATISFVTFILFTKSNAKSYRDHLLIHGYPASDSHLDFFKELDTFYNVTFWRKPSLINRPVEFSLSRLNFDELIRDTRDMDIEFSVVIRDLQKVFDEQTVKPYVRRQMESFNWQNYYSVDDIYNWLRDLSESHPKELHLNSIGQSVQKRHILSVKVQLEDKSDQKRSTVMIEGGCHAREWISPAFVTYMINTILNAKNSSNEQLRTIAQSYIWIFIPLLNPDGYAYSQQTDRLWRKNYHGVDLNRNFGVAFGKFGASKKKQASEEYCGKEPFSEPETSALAKFVSDNSQHLEYYIAFHSYGQYIIIPYAFDEEHLDNFDIVKVFANNMATRSSQSYKIYYNVGTAYDTVGYKASGTSTDWVKKTANVPYAITIELPDQGYYGFALPKDEILPTCEATMDILLTFLTPKNDSILRMSQLNGVHRQKASKAVILFYTLLYGIDRF